MSGESLTPEEEETLRKREIAHEKLAQCIQECVSEGLVGPPLGLLGGWVLVVSEIDMFEGVTSTNAVAMPTQVPAMTLGLARILARRAEYQAAGC